MISFFQNRFYYWKLIDIHARDFHAGVPGQVLRF